MTAEQLKNSILQEAISGRLVPQDPNDEPASVLLERIVAEQNKTLPPKKKKSVSLIAEPEDITPVSGWAYFYIKDLFDTTSGGTPIKGHPEYYDGDIPWVRSGELNSLYLYDSELRITEAGLKNSSAKYFPVDTVVIAMYGATIGKTSIFKRSMTTNQAICGIFPIDGILPEYIYYFLQNKKRDYCSIAFGSGQPNISQEKIKNTIFPLPPLAEQKRIVAKLEELLPIVEQYGKAQKELDELNAALPARLRQSILQEAISGRLIPQDEKEGTAEELLKRIDAEKQRLIKVGKLKNEKASSPITEDEIPFEIPSSWEWVSHNYLFNISGGTQPPKSEFVYEPREGYIRLYQIRDYGKTPQPVYIPYKKTLKISKEGDILLARYGASLGKVFFAKDGAYNVAIARVIPQYESELINTKYIYWYYKSSIYQHHITDRSRCAQAGFNKDDLNNLYFPLPPLAEQQRIVAKIEELFAEIDKLK